MKDIARHEVKAKRAEKRERKLAMIKSKRK